MAAAERGTFAIRPGSQANTPQKGSFVV